ncbi:MAG TPA: double zinc ribbon domain-containing protein [Pyrinomonadaceae bacterium]|nr:double zinc ribbon domain-containing protein [Pyrinomonadaceae bacterium]
MIAQRGARLMSPATHFIDSLYDAALALLYPQACEVCGASVEARRDGLVCAACWRETRIFNEADTLCWKCGAPSDATISPEKRMDVRCRRCEHDAYDGARACGLYQGALRGFILALKREPHVSTRIAQLLYETQRRAPLSTATRIMPVPLHPERQRERGFNQAAILGGALADLTGLPLDVWSLVRTRHTERHRAGMDAQARRESVAEAFEVARPRLIENESILLIDDVLTTGATVSACAAALKAAGARAVFVLTLARP